MQDPKALKEAVKVLYQKHVTEAIKPAELDADILQEYGRQREYLEKTVGAPLHPLFNLIPYFGCDLGRKMGFVFKHGHSGSVRRKCWVYACGIFGPFQAHNPRLSAIFCFGWTRTLYRNTDGREST